MAGTMLLCHTYAFGSPGGKARFRFSNAIKVSLEGPNAFKICWDKTRSCRIQWIFHLHMCVCNPPPTPKSCTFTSRSITYLLSSYPGLFWVLSSSLSAFDPGLQRGRGVKVGLTLWVTSKHKSRCAPQSTETEGLWEMSNDHENGNLHFPHNEPSWSRLLSHVRRIKGSYSRGIKFTSRLLGHRNQVFSI